MFSLQNFTSRKLPVTLQKFVSSFYQNTFDPGHKHLYSNWDNLIHFNIIIIVFDSVSKSKFAGKEYSKGDSRYAARDAGVVAVEGITAVLEGPACLIAAYVQIYGHYLIIHDNKIHSGFINSELSFWQVLNSNFCKTARSPNLLLNTAMGYGFARSHFCFWQ